MVLSIAFLSQQAFLGPIAANILATISKTMAPYISKLGSWFGASVYPKVSGEVSTVQQKTVQEITTQKNNVMQMIWQRIKNYFAEKFSNISGTKVK